MKKIIKLTERELNRIVRKVIKESESPCGVDPISGIPLPCDDTEHGMGVVYNEETPIITMSNTDPYEYVVTNIIGDGMTTKYYLTRRKGSNKWLNMEDSLSRSNFEKAKGVIDDFILDNDVEFSEKRGGHRSRNAGGGGLYHSGKI